MTLIHPPGVSQNDLDALEISLAADIATVDIDTSKIDDVAVNGLTGVSNSLAYRVEELEKHFHNQEKWYGRNDSTGFVEKSKLAPWTVTTGNSETFGPWVQLTNGTQWTEGTYFDAHRVQIMSASTTGILYYLQLGIGESGSQVQVTTFPVFPNSNQIDASPVEVMMGRQLLTEKLWARCKCNNNGSSITFVIGVHFYEG